MDLIATLKRPEGKTLEFKRDLSSPRGIVRTVVAFANTAGGVLLVGVEDKTTHNAAARSEWPSSRIEWKWRTQACCPSASRSRTCRVASPNSAIA